MIPSSELVINKGRIYHLDLAPDEVATQIILVGDPTRADKVAEKLDSIELRRSHREFYTITGQFNNKRISVIGTGIGVSNIEIVMNEIDALFNIDFKLREPTDTHTKLTFLRLGTSGTIQNFIEPGTLVFTEDTIGFDAIADFYDFTPKHKKWHSEFEKYVRENFPEFPKYYFAESLGNWKIPGNILKGITITAPGFYSPQGRNIKRYNLKYQGFPHKLASYEYKDKKILNVEMEASMINFLGNILGHNTATLCVVLANRDKKSFIKNYDKAIDDLISEGLKILTASQ